MQVHQDKSNRNNNNNKYNKEVLQLKLVTKLKRIFQLSNNNSLRNNNSKNNSNNNNNNNSKPSNKMMHLVNSFQRNTHSIHLVSHLNYHKSKNNCRHMQSLNHHRCKSVRG